MPRPTHQYALEFCAALDWSAAYGLMTPPLRFRARKDFIDWTCVTPVMERVLAPFSDAQIASQALLINRLLLAHLRDECGVRLMLTMGWIQTPHDRYLEHGQDVPARLLKNGFPRSRSFDFPMHVWLTSPGFEIIDVVLPLRMTAEPGTTAGSRQVFYFSNEDDTARLVYHPTVIGDDFVEQAIAGVRPRGGAASSGSPETARSN